jgi:eukaryotic-like serine/threonine-protein kinase
LNPELHKLVKEVFSEICELPADKQLARIERLAKSNPELASELRSLLNYHKTQSFEIESPPPKIRTRSTLSRTFRSGPSRWLRTCLQACAYALPIALLGLILGYWTNQRIHSLLHTSASTQLEDLIDQRLQQFRQWESNQTSNVVEWGKDEEVTQSIRQLVKLAADIVQEGSQKSMSDLAEAEPAKMLGSRLKKLIGPNVKYAVWDRRMMTIADWSQAENPKLVGAFATPAGASMLTEVFAGVPRLYLPGKSATITEGFVMEKGVMNIFALVPILGENEDVEAALMLRGHGLAESFTELFDKWAKLQSSETYLVSDRGALITNSRYGDALDRLSLATSESKVLVYDPGVNLLAGKKSNYTPMAWSPTFSARQVTSGNNGMSVDGYRNYVGMEVVGAWRWLADHRLGLTVEQHADDAFAIAKSARNAILLLTGLFALSMATVGLLMSRRLGRGSMSNISDVGPYQMQELLGEGGMGRVYLAEHALLCRQSAVKVLSGNDIDLSVINRFEREVQLASQLTHPNTIAIYDFGRDKDGKFYYAMEYINGAHLGQLVDYAGPIHPGRSIFLLRQLCRALSEAHQAGVVHRDIKPQNIMVCNRGGEPDFVKLFDYGLVKAFAPGVSHGNTSQTRIVVGTPRFMAPERLNSPWLADPRVDIYSVGAVAYYLLTGKLPPLFTLSGPSSSEQPGIETLDLPVGAIEFGDLLGVCLSPEPSDRPSSMQVLLKELEELSEKFPWSREDSVVWWQNHEAKLLKHVRGKRQALQADKVGP